MRKSRFSVAQEPEETGFAVFDCDERNGNIPVIEMHCLNGLRVPPGLVIIYGGSTRVNFRHRVADCIGEGLVKLGFTVFCFDFRSNLDEDRFHEFGLWDRLEDAREVVNRIMESENAPFSLMGMSMGGPLAVTLAAELGKRVKNLFLVAPAAYSREVMDPTVKFGPRFTEILRRPDSWRETASFEEAKIVKADTLVLRFTQDDVVPKEIPVLYASAISGMKREGQKVELVKLSGPHNGSFDNYARQIQIVEAVAKFCGLDR